MEEQENRDPFPCPKCDTVNIWNATICRDCGAPISKAMVKEAETIDQITTEVSSISDEETADSAASNRPSQIIASARRRWNVFWIVLGIAIHVTGIHLGVFSIIKFLVEPDAEVKATIEKTLEAAKNNSVQQAALLENAAEPLKSKLQTIRSILIFLLAVVPILIGMSAGFFARTILDGAASMGLSAVLIPLLNGAAEYAIVWGPINAMLGAIGAFIGVNLARRLRSTGAPNDTI